MIGRTLLDEAPDLLARLVEESGVLALALVGPDGTILSANQGFCRALLLDEPPLGEPVDAFLVGIEETPWLEVAPDAERQPNALRSPQGESLWVDIFRLGDRRLLVLERLGRGDQEVVADLSRMTGYLASLSHDLRQKTTALSAANERIEELNRRDPLTGLYNRRQFDEVAEQRIAESRRHDQALSVMMLDLDHFKRVNDTYGHDQGDIVLRAVAYLILSTCRAEDLAVRFGGEEFLLLLPYTDRDGALRLADRIRAALRTTAILPEGEPVTASAGVATLTDEDDVRSLVQRADRALYAAKSEGRDRSHAA